MDFNDVNLHRDELGHFVPMTPLVSGAASPTSSHLGITKGKHNHPLPSNTSVNSSPFREKSRPSYIIRRKTIPTKRMVRNAFKAGAVEGRKHLSLAAIRKFIANHYLFTPEQIQARMRYVKKYINEAIGSGHIIRMRGKGLSGSFRLTTKGQKKKYSKETNDSKIQVPKEQIPPESKVAHQKKRGRPKKVSNNSSQIISVKTPTRKPTRNAAF